MGDMCVYVRVREEAIASRVMTSPQLAILTQRSCHLSPVSISYSVSKTISLSVNLPIVISYLMFSWLKKIFALLGFRYLVLIAFYFEPFRIKYLSPETGFFKQISNFNKLSLMSDNFPILKVNTVLPL